MTKPKRQRITDLEIAKRFKYGMTVTILALCYNKPMDEIEAAIRRILRKQGNVRHISGR